MDSSVSGKDEIWFLRVCHHVPHELYHSGFWIWIRCCLFPGSKDIWAGIGTGFRYDLYGRGIAVRFPVRKSLDPFFKASRAAGRTTFRIFVLSLSSGSESGKDLPKRVLTMLCFNPSTQVWRYKVKRRITTFRSTMDRMYDGGPII